MTYTDPNCLLCQSQRPDDLVRRIKSAKMGKPMTADAFMKWLRKIV
jgi:hypothetical protein